MDNSNRAGCGDCRHVRADEFGFGSIVLVTLGCVRQQCHLDACSMGIATQKNRNCGATLPETEHVTNFFFCFLAEECREIMAELGLRLS